MKRCKDCGVTKPASEFYINGGTPMNPCKVCRRQQRSLVGLKSIHKTFTKKHT